MISETTSEARLPKHAEWIWSHWLKEQKPSRLQYQRFTHFEFIEDETKRVEVTESLARLLYDYHSCSPVNTNLLAQLRYQKLASVLIRNSDQRPRDAKTRSGNFVEILACEFAKKQGYDIPVMRLHFNPNRDQSMKGDDILGFLFSEDGRNQDEVLVGEGKFRRQFNSEVVKDAYNDLTRKSLSFPVSMDFTATILSLQGDGAQAARIRQLRQRIASQDKRTIQKHLLFLGTVGQPHNPFEFLEAYDEELLANLTAVNICFKEDLVELLEQVYMM